ncbi:MAG: hypothetical protein U5Q44_08310 [Dehalococcoidia bacterium]|nr:hypothetical protein [Dehalococcoidia bacterium]
MAETERTVGAYYIIADAADRGRARQSVAEARRLLAALEEDTSLPGEAKELARGESPRASLAWTQLLEAQFEDDSERGSATKDATASAGWVQGALHALPLVSAAADAPEAVANATQAVSKVADLIQTVIGALS